MASDFLDYDLPPGLIAQEPCPDRGQSRLLVLRREDDGLDHRVFHDLPKLLSPGDLLVLNDTRVLPARLLGHRAKTKGRWEGLFLRQTPEGPWEMMCQSRGRLVEGETVVVEPGALKLQLVRKTPEGRWLVVPESSEPVLHLLERFGKAPLPPYIRKGRESAGDRERYQTVFARKPGAVAAPTAGLHFSPEVFDQLTRRGIAWTFVTLHVGLGTFQPLQTPNYTEHKMHPEWGELSNGAVEAITACKSRGGRVVAVGTTVVRVLETVAAEGPLRPWSGETRLYVYPPYSFRVVDSMVTNFHLPRSSLLLLIMAFAGVEKIRKAYTTAIEQQYRFYSYGDAMLIV